jgi:hypothetical protein
MLPRVALVRPDISQERIASIIRVTKLGEQETKLLVTSNRNTPLKFSPKGFCWSHEGKTNSVVFSSQEKYTDRRLPLVSEVIT